MSDFQWIMQLPFKCHNVLAALYSTMAFGNYIYKLSYVVCCAITTWSVYSKILTIDTPYPLQWHHNGRDSVSNHQPQDCFLNCLVRHRSKKTSKLRVTGLCAGNSQEAGEFPAQMASNTENVSIWWRHHVSYKISFLSDVCTALGSLLLTWISFNPSMDYLSNDLQCVCGMTLLIHSQTSAPLKFGNDK